MSTSKSIKISSGKILDYTITKDGFKTIHGSKLINSNDTIDIDMIADTETTYYFGQRIGGIATIVGEYSSNDGKKYAFAVLDSTYYDRTVWASGLYGINTGLPDYSSELTSQNKESATYNTDYIINNYTDQLIEAFTFVRNVGNLTFNGKLYQFQLPNAYELQQIYNNRIELYNLDPTASSNTSYDLKNWSFYGSSGAWSSNESYSNHAYIVTTSGSLTSYAKNGANGTFGVIPIIEIPL